MLIDGLLPLSPIGFVVGGGDWPLDLLVINMNSFLSLSEQMCGGPLCPCASDKRLCLLLVQEHKLCLAVYCLHRRSPTKVAS